MWFRRIEEVYEVDQPQLSIPSPWKHKAEFGKTSFQIGPVRFGPARSFKWIIGKSPLQVYVSALAI